MKIIEIASYSSIFILYLISLTLLTGKQGNRLPGRLLSLHLALRGSIMLAAMLAEMHQLAFVKPLVWMVPLLQQLIPVSCYYYIRANASEGYRITGKQYLFLLPLLPTLLIYIYGLFFLNPIGTQDVDILFGAGNTFSDISILAHRKLLMVYKNVLYLIYGLFTYKVALHQIFSRQQPAKRKWVKTFLILYCLFFAISLTHTVIYLGGDLSVGSILSMNLLKYISILAAYTLLYVIFKNPSVIYGHVFGSAGVAGAEPTTEVKELLPEPRIPLIASDTEPLRANDIKLSDEKAASYFAELSGYLMETQEFLKQDFVLTDLSSHTKIPTNYISYSISKMGGMNFREYINSLRIQHFIAQYEQLSGQYTIDTIAEHSGFRSKATFYTAFKRQTGKTPADYFKSAENTDEKK